MKITYDNIIYSMQRAGGISAYWSELSSRLINNSASVNFYGYPNENIFMKYLDNPVQQETLLSYKINRYLDFRKRLPKGSVFHSSYYRIANQKDVANIITVYDFTYEYYRKGLARFIHVWQKKRAISKSDGIICISENTKRDLLRFHPSISEDKIKVIYISASDKFFQLNKPEKILDQTFSQLNDKKYILYVGDRSIYKNLNIAVDTVQKVDNCTLVIIGGSDLSENEKSDLGDDFFHFQGVSVEELNILYNNAFCLLYPSSYEGFGIPVTEAIRAGCPVVSTNLSSIPEVAGDAALLVDNITVESLVKEIEKLEDNDFRDEIIVKGLEQSKKFSWDRCFEETFEFYKEVAGKKFI
jgi:mannosyltransferase